MADGLFYPPPDLSGYAQKAEVPVMAAYTPSPEINGGAAGAAPLEFSDGKHQHPRVTSSRPLTLDSGGLGVATFTRSFSSEPTPSFAQMPGSSGPCIFAVESWIMTGPLYTGANIRGWKLGAPTQTLAAVTVLSVSVAVGGQTITTYGPAANVKVSVIMLPDSSV